MYGVGTGLVTRIILLLNFTFIYRTGNENPLPLHLHIHLSWVLEWAGDLSTLH